MDGTMCNLEWRYYTPLQPTPRRPDGIEYAMGKVQGSSSLTLSQSEFLQEDIPFTALLLHISSVGPGHVEKMSLECDVIGKDGLNAISRYLRGDRHLTSLSLDDVSLCAIFLGYCISGNLK
jgi:hypothetical protein